MIIDFEKMYCTQIERRKDKFSFPTKVYLGLEDIPVFIEEYNKMLSSGILLNVSDVLESIILSPTMLDVQQIREQLK